jgi:hypothetical protein
VEIVKDILSNSETALSSLSCHHLVIENLLNRINSHEGDRSLLVKELFVQLRVHSILEQQFLFPDISTIVGKDVLKSAGKEFYEMLALMLELEQVNVESPVFDQALLVLGERFDKHARDQRRLFTELEHKKDAQQLAALDRVMDANKRELCDTMRLKMHSLSPAQGPIGMSQHVRCS